MTTEQPTRLLDFETTIALYAKGPDLLEAAIAGLTCSELDRRLDETNWSIRQIVHHIADGDDLWKAFIKQAAGSPGGRFPLNWYWDLPQDEWVRRWQYAILPVEPALAAFRANRTLTAQLLMLIPETWGNRLQVVWPSGKEEQVSVGEVVGMQAHHIVGHVEDIRKFLEACLDDTQRKRPSAERP
jgi:hypothetical protein